MATLLLLLGMFNPANAQETLELGALTDEDVTVVQRILYPKTGRTELGAHLGVMPFDAFLVTPNVQLSLDMHQSERLSISVLAGGGYGLRNGTSNALESPTYGVTPYAQRYLASALAGVQWAPIYAKLNWSGARVVHFDVYGTARAGVTLQKSIIPDGRLGVGPTISPGIGTRFFVGPNTALRVELRDDLVIERRALTSSWALKQNAGITVGITMLSKVEERP